MTPRQKSHALMYLAYAKDNAETESPPMPNPTIDRVRAIHRVLDEAAPIVAAHARVTAITAELTSDGSREARYELQGGSSTYLIGDGRDVAAQFIASELEKRTAASYPEAIRFTADEVKAWPATKERLRFGLTQSTTDAAVVLLPMANGATYVAGGADANWLQTSSLPDVIAQAALGLCMYREQLDDASDDLAPEYKEAAKEMRHQAVNWADAKLSELARGLTVSSEGGFILAPPNDAPAYRITRTRGRYTKPRQPAQPWTIPTGPAVCAACDAPCEVATSLDLYTASDHKDYPVCESCFDVSQEDDDEIDRRILRKVDLTDVQIAAMQAAHDERAKTGKVRERREVGHPAEGRSDRVYAQQNKRFP